MFSLTAPLVGSQLSRSPQLSMPPVPSSSIRSPTPPFCSQSSQSRVGPLRSQDAVSGARPHPQPPALLPSQTSMSVPWGWGRPCQSTKLPTPTPRDQSLLDLGGKGQGTCISTRNPLPTDATLRNTVIGVLQLPPGRGEQHRTAATAGRVGSSSLTFTASLEATPLQ